MINLDNGVSPSTLSLGDCFTDEFNDSYRVLDKVHKDSRVELEVLKLDGSITYVSYTVAGGNNDRVMTITENEFNSLRNQFNKSKSDNALKRHIIYMMPTRSINNRDIKYLNSKGQFTYTKQIAKKFTRDEANRVLAKLNKSSKENVYKYGIE